MNQKRLILAAKIIVLAAVLGWVSHELWKAWHGATDLKLAIAWQWGLIAIAGFSASMITSALIWRWLAWKMGEERQARSLPTIPLLGAYTFSQMGKYIPGKVALLLMRIERSSRFGMTTGACTLTTLLENAIYIVSGGLVGMTAIFRVLQELRDQGVITARQQQWQWPLVIAAVVALAFIVHPAVFYGLVNRLLRKMKKTEVSREERLGVMPLIAAVAGFLPCWLFGGIALWASTRCVSAQLDPTACLWFAGAYALSVILGMVSFLPAGLGIRELVLGVAVTLALPPSVGHQNAVMFGVAAAGLQRLFQVIAELLMGALGALATSRPQGPAARTSDRGVDKVKG